MKTLTQTIIPIVVLSLSAAGVVSANNASDEEIQAAAAVQVKEAELEQQADEVAAMLAQAQSGQPATPAPPTVPTPTPAVPKPATPPTPPTLPGISKNIYNLTNAISYGSRTGGSDMVLVIPTEQTKTEDLIAINEDMNVMSRIFEKNLEQDRIATARSGILFSGRDPFGMLLGSSRGDVQSIYLQGYGALFLLKVGFPLSPLSDVQEEEKETQKAEEGDPIWQETVQEMYEPESARRRHRSEQPEEKYDPEKVENLKTTLIKTLKHATNIRVLKPDESVILTVVGKGESTGVTIAAAKAVPGEDQIIIVEKNADGTKTQKVVQGSSLDVLDDLGLSSPTVLVIRAKKSDIDEFSNGDIDYEKFHQRVRLLTYPLLGGAGDGSRDLFNPYIQLRSTGSSNRR